MPNTKDGDDTQDRGDPSAGTRPGDSTKRVRDSQAQQTEGSEGQQGAPDNSGTEERIHRRAYEKWESEGRQDGHHERHWREAQVEVQREQSSKRTRVQKQASAQDNEPANSTSRSSRRR